MNTTLNCKNKIPQILQYNNFLESFKFPISSRWGYSVESLLQEGENDPYFHSIRKYLQTS